MHGVNCNIKAAAVPSVSVAPACLHVADLTPPSVEDSLDQKSLRGGIKDKRQQRCVQMCA